MNIAVQAKRRVVGVCGWKNSGKTTLATRLIAEFVARGLSVASVKHAHHSFEIDQPGRDSMRHREAGSSEVAIVSRSRFAIIGELHGAAEPSLDDILARLSPRDIVVVEGYKGEPIAKIEVRRRASQSQESLAARDPKVIAIAADHPVQGEKVPIFELDDIAGLADFISRTLDLKVMDTCD